ncbi:MAG TPA: uroporphyrinogen decarboxylase family protein [Candidatus Tectomicrobia bacterium]|nr:uroporphyrinogen decarboxylase family protein [Candidatus Tectomicrobia bacterium]
MIDVETADRELQRYVRPQTFPVAVRMLAPGEPIPERARRPARDFKKLSMNCQVIDMARRYGWTLALTREDSICSLGIAALGFDRPTHLHASGTLCEGMYTETKEAGRRSEAAVDRFAPGAYAALLVAPLDRAAFEPHLVVVYATPAQVMRLVQAALWKRGGKLASAFGGRVDCSEIIVTTMRTGEPQVILPCSGDRIFGQTQDHEMAFSIPWTRMEEIVEGLRGTHAGGIRYPITQFMEYEAKLPPRYMEANRVWDAERGAAAYTPRERVVAAYKRSFADRVPAYPIVASFAGTLDGLSIEEYCTNVSKAIPAMLRYYERYQPDVVLAYNDLAKEAEAFGCRVKYSDYVVPSIDRHVLQDDKAQLAGLAMPDPYRTARLPDFLEQCEALVKAKLPAAIGAVAVGPWTIAMLLRNPETMLLDTFEDPQFIHDVMRVTTDFCKVWGDAIVKTGIGLSFSEPTASISLISPDNYRQFVAPYHRELCDHFKAKKVGVTTHICGTTYPIFEDVIQAGFTTFSFDLDQQADPTLHVDQLQRFVEIARGRAVAIGNVDATKFERTTKQAMEADVRRCIDTAARHSGFILSTSCEIPPRSDPEAVRWFMEAAREYGRYDRLF